MAFNRSSFGYVGYYGVKWVAGWEGGYTCEGVEERMLYQKRSWIQIGVELEGVSQGGPHCASDSQKCCSLCLSDFLRYT